VEKGLPFTTDSEMSAKGEMLFNEVRLQGFAKVSKLASLRTSG
jgi:hypothetical protein